MSEVKISGSWSMRDISTCRKHDVEFIFCSLAHTSTHSLTRSKIFMHSNTAVAPLDPLAKAQAWARSYELRNDIPTIQVLVK